MQQETSHLPPPAQPSMRRVQVRRFGVLSVAKMLGTLQALFGLIIGAIFSLLSVATGLVGAIAQEDPTALIGVVFGVGAIIFFPLLYGVIGFISAAIFTALYNLMAGLVGGIEMEIRDL